MCGGDRGRIGRIGRIDLGDPDALPPTAAERSAALVAPQPATHEEVGTITEALTSAGCGIFVSVAEVRYGDRFGVLVPCIELHIAAGLRFAVGDTHHLLVDDNDVVRAIEWNGHRYAMDTTLPAVKTPATAIGHITAVDPTRHYDAPGWRWDAARLHD